MRARAGSGFWGVVLEAPDAGELAEFYSRLLDRPIEKSEPGWAVLLPVVGVGYLAFQTDDDYVRPVWPTTPGAQQMMMHLDIEVDDLASAVEDAVDLGAEVAEFQPQETVRVLLDPAGHPFCLYVDA